MYIASSQPHFDDVMRQLKELKELAGTAVTAYDASRNYQDHSPSGKRIAGVFLVDHSRIMTLI